MLEASCLICYGLFHHDSGFHRYNANGRSKDSTEKKRKKKKKKKFSANLKTIELSLNGNIYFAFAHLHILAEIAIDDDDQHNISISFRMVICLDAVSMCFFLRIFFLSSFLSTYSHIKTHSMPGLLSRLYIELHD